MKRANRIYLHSLLFIIPEQTLAVHLGFGASPEGVKITGKLVASI